MALKTYRDSVADAISVQEVTGLTNAAIEIQAGGASGTVLHFLVIDNLLNTALSYLKMWNNDGSPAVDTLEPDIIIPIAGKKEYVMHMLNGLSGVFEAATIDMHAIATPTKESGNTTANVTQNAPTNQFDCDLGSQRPSEVSPWHWSSVG